MASQNGDSNNLAIFFNSNVLIRNKHHKLGGNSSITYSGQEYARQLGCFLAVEPEVRQSPRIIYLIIVYYDLYSIYILFTTYYMFFLLSNFFCSSHLLKIFNAACSSSRENTILVLNSEQNDSNCRVSYTSFQKPEGNLKPI